MYVGDNKPPTRCKEERYFQNSSIVGDRGPSGLVVGKFNAYTCIHTYLHTYIRTTTILLILIRVYIHTYTYMHAKYIDTYLKDFVA